MPNERLSMRKVKEALCLYFEAGLKPRSIARSLLSPSTVGDYLRGPKVAGLTWRLPEAMDEAEFERRLFSPSKRAQQKRPLSDWAWVHQEMKRKGMTLALLWYEYKSAHAEAEGIQYSCSLTIRN